ncbi:MAG: prolipoprotein diacylglyceryl transferase [Lachnospiraceae bacterium]|nr:prolipoprotein diacylglyceryl transferase [Lachnospiraceae bacterium]
MHNEIFTIGKITIHGYGLMIGIGFLVAVLVGMYRAKKKGLNPEAVLDIAIYAILAGFLGGKILFVIVEWKRFLENPWSVLGSSGFVVYGGIITGVLAGYIYTRIKKISFAKYFDLVMPEIALAQGFGRIGCFLAGCCYGRQTDSWLGVIFPAGSMAPSGVKLLPTQLFMSAGDFLIALILILYSRKNKIDGNVGAGYLVLYGAGRFAIEFLRNDARGSVGTLSTSQFISIFIVAAGIGLIVWNTMRARRGVQKADEK